MKSILGKLGPGLLYAGAAVGVSHLVQSTRAGANYGLLMILVVIIANILKYPFFKAGPLYAASTGKSLLEGFHNLGNWAMALFYLVTFTTMFAVMAAVTLITASIVSSIFSIEAPLWLISGIILTISSIILVIGKYKLLGNLMKTVILILTVTTLITLLAACINYQPTTTPLDYFSFDNTTDIFFLIALVGWMPAPLDISLWHSEWTLAEVEGQNKGLNPSKALFDFKIGYWGTTFLAVIFVALGAIILRGNEQGLSSNGVQFSNQIIKMYTSTLGKWSFLFIALAAFTTMFSTTLTVLDAYPRILNKAFSLQLKKNNTKDIFYKKYWFWLLITVIGAIFILVFQLKNMKQLIDFATTISFLTAPILASLIYFLSTRNKVKIFTRADKLLAFLGIIFLFSFSGYYLWVKL